MKYLFLILTVFILFGCSEQINELENKVLANAKKNGKDLSFFQLKKDAYFIYQWSKEETFRDEINEFKRLDEKNFPKKEKILFTGSSSIRFWDSLEIDMEPLEVLNRGFGGAQISHVIHHFEEIVKPYKPKAIVFFCGTNDLTALKTPKEALNDLNKFLSLVKNEIGDIKVYVIGIKPSISRLYLEEEEKAFNHLVKLLAAEDTYVEYIDVWNSMLSEDGSRMPDLYIEDGLHMNKKGYEVWTKLVRKSLSKDFNI